MLGLQDLARLHVGCAEWVCLNPPMQVCDLVINAPIKSWLRLFKGDLNYDDFRQFRRDFKHAALHGKPLPQWQPPKVAMWKALEHLETLSRTKLSSDSFKAAIRNGWIDAGFLSADGCPPPVYNHQNFCTKKRRLKRLRSRFGGGGPLFCRRPRRGQVGRREQARCAARDGQPRG